MYIRGKTPADVAGEMGITLTSLYSKLGGRTDFKLSEAENLIHILDIENPVSIFFDQQVH